MKRPAAGKRITYRFAAIPKIFFEQWLPFLSDTELRVYFYLAYRIWGAGKKKDEISVGQICSGFQDHNGKQVDHGTGYCARTVDAALLNLQARGLLIKRTQRKNRANVYELTTAWNELDLPRSPLRTKPGSGTQPLAHPATQPAAHTREEREDHEHRVVPFPGSAKTGAK